MKAILFAFASLLALTSPATAEDHSPANSPAKAAEGLFRHIVMVQFKAETTAKQIEAIEKQFAELEEKIDTIIDYEWGPTAMKDRGLDQGYTHCFLVTFQDKAGLEVYLPHEAHQAFVKVFKPQIEKLLVFDYVAQ